MTNSAKDIFNTDLILVFGADPTENHSILGGHIMQAHAQGAELAGAPADDCTGARQVKKRALGAIYTLK